MRVTWTDEAKERLSDQYVTCTLDEQRDLARTVLRINALLGIRPDLLGESREGWARVWFEGRLMVRFEIINADDEVVVTDVVLLRSGRL